MTENSQGKTNLKILELTLKTAQAFILRVWHLNRWLAVELLEEGGISPFLVLLTVFSNVFTISILQS